MAFRGNGKHGLNAALLGRCGAALLMISCFATSAAGQAVPGLGVVESLSAPDLGKLATGPRPGGLGNSFRPPPGSGRSSLRSSNLRTNQILAVNASNPLIITNSTPPSFNQQTLQSIRQRRSQQRRIAAQTARQSTVRKARHSAGHALSLGFPVDPPVEAARRTDDLDRRARNLEQQLGAEGLSIVVEGNTAILRGTVENDADRNLVARVVLLEPGIYAVEDQLSTRAPPEPLE
jgi:hypothetical protein